MGEQSRVEPTEGVTLTQYAAVVAAKAEGHPLAEALAWAGVPAGAWSTAAAAWRKTLAADPAALEAHHVELAKAEDRLHRSVPPIEEDAAAWVAFMGCVEEAPDVIPLLAQVDLGPNDVSRLTRAWTRRLAADAALRKRMAELRARDGAVMPAVRPAPRAPIQPAAQSEPPAAVSEAPAVSAAEPPSPPPSVRVPIVVPTYLITTASPLAGKQVPALTPGPGRGGTTVDVSEVRQSEPALPFMPRAVERSAGATEDVSAFAESVAVLPFAPKDPAPAAPLAPLGGAAPRIGVIGGGATLDLSALSALMESEGMEGVAALPFLAQPPRPGAGLTQDVGEVPGSETALPFSPAAAAPAAAPEQGPGQGAAVELTMEQYASLCVEISLHPTRTAEVLARFRLDAEQGAALDALWARRLAESPAARVAFEQARATYRTWLLGASR